VGILTLVAVKYLKEIEGQTYFTLQDIFCDAYTIFAVHKKQYKNERLQAFNKPDSIFVRIFRAHFKNVSSTFSPVNALVSRNIKSAN
jgi:hypothetical protein